MSYITDIFDRLNIQQITSFLLYGVKRNDISSEAYEQRLENACDSAIEKIRVKYPNTEECEEITKEVFKYVSTVQEIYMEIGLQCGASLERQLNRRNARGRRLQKTP